MGFYEAVHTLLESSKIPDLTLTSDEKKFVKDFVLACFSLKDGKAFGHVNENNIFELIYDRHLREYRPKNDDEFYYKNNLKYRFLFSQVEKNDEDKEEAWEYVKLIFTNRVSYPNLKGAEFKPVDYDFTVAMVNNIGDMDKDVPNIKEIAEKAVGYFFLRAIYAEPGDEYVRRIQKIRGIKPFTSDETYKIFKDLY
jgi:hypothetical protein